MRGSHDNFDKKNDLAIREPSISDDSDAIIKKDNNSPTRYGSENNKFQEKKIRSNKNNLKPEKLQSMNDQAAMN